MNIKSLLLLLNLSFFGVLILFSQPLARISPEKAGLNAEKLANADALIQSSISKKEIPGAVLAVVRKGKMAYLKAYGNKQVYPTVEPMTVNTVFDLASVSKSMSTAVSIMVLIERGLIGLNDNVSSYIPEFNDFESGSEKVKIKIVHLLTHTSGLPPYASVSMLEKRYGLPTSQKMMFYIDSCKRDFEPATKMQYSCLNYITLQAVVERISKKNLQDFSKENIFDILGMQKTTYNSTGQLKEKCAPTERQKDDTVLKGVVHDSLARIMNGGISGNAGLFSDANDMAVLAAALLNNGEINGKRILSPLTVKLMSSIAPGLEKFGRTPGWDMYSAYASCKGDLLSAKTYCHTGYTGTSLVIDPENDIAIILLTNRVHPVDKGSVVKLRSAVANAIAGAITK